MAYEQTGPKGISVARLKAALRKHAGVYVLAANELGCDRSNVAQRINRSPELQAFVAAIEEEIGDVAESVIKSTMIQAADLAARRNMAKWYASMKLSGRGYRSRQEIVGKDGEALAPASQAVHFHVSYHDAPKPAAETEEDVV